MLTGEQLQAYKKDGFILLKNLFDAEEIGLLKKAAMADRELDRRSSTLR